MDATTPTEKKDMTVQDITDAQTKVSDIKSYGEGDYWRLVHKETFIDQSGMKSVKAAATDNGLIIQITFQLGTAVAESLVYLDGLVPADLPKLEVGTEKHRKFWKPIGGASSAAQGWEKGSEAIELPMGTGVLIRAFTVQSGNIAQSVTHIFNGALEARGDGTYRVR